MSKRKRVFSATEAVRVLTRHFGFSVIKQRGSHIKCRKVDGGRKITTIVPNHKELAKGTLGGILELAEIDFEDFLKKTFK